MDWKLLAEADRIVGQLSPGKRESVREVVVNASDRGILSEGARQFIDRVTRSSLVSEVLAAAIEESAYESSKVERGLGHGAGRVAIAALDCADVRLAIDRN